MPDSTGKAPQSPAIQVVGAVIVQDGLVLCAQCGSQSKLPGLWEFPGGKVEAVESQPLALAREILEELGCNIIVGNKITTTNHAYDFATIALSTFYCRIATGTPRPTEHKSIKWLHPNQLHSLAWAPADVPTMRIVQREYASHLPT